MSRSETTFRPRRPGSGSPPATARRGRCAGAEAERAVPTRRTPPSAIVAHSSATERTAHLREARSWTSPNDRSSWKSGNLAGQLARCVVQGQEEGDQRRDALAARHIVHVKLVADTGDAELARADERRRTERVLCRTDPRHRNHPIVRVGEHARAFAPEQQSLEAQRG